MHRLGISNVGREVMKWHGQTSGAVDRLMIFDPAGPAMAASSPPADAIAQAAVAWIEPAGSHQVRVAVTLDDRADRRWKTRVIAKAVGHLVVSSGELCFAGIGERQGDEALSSSLADGRDAQGDAFRIAVPPGRYAVRCMWLDWVDQQTDDALASLPAELREHYHKSGITHHAGCLFGSLGVVLLAKAGVAATMFGHPLWLWIAIAIAIFAGIAVWLRQRKSKGRMLGAEAKRAFDAAYEPMHADYPDLVVRLKAIDADSPHEPGVVLRVDDVFAGSPHAVVEQLETP